MAALYGQKKSALATMTVREMFSLWWRERWIRAFVLSIAPIGVADVIFTMMLIQIHGIEYEYNPFVRWAMVSNLWVLWIIADIVSFVAFAMIAGSYYIHTRRSVLGTRSNLFAGLIALRVSAVSYNVLVIYYMREPIVPSFIIGLLVYRLCNSLLSRERDISIEGFKSWLWWKYYRLNERLLLRGIPMETELEEPKAKAMNEAKQTDKQGIGISKAWLKRAGLLMLAVILFLSIPYVTMAIGLIYGTIYGQSFSGSNLYWTIEGGRTFLTGFFAIVLMLGIVLYIILNAFDSKEGAW